MCPLIIPFPCLPSPHPKISTYLLSAHVDAFAFSIIWYEWYRTVCALFSFIEVQFTYIYTCKKMKLDLYVTPFTKINSKWIKGLNVRTNIIKFLEQNMRVNLCDLGWCNSFLVMIPKLQTIRTITKINYTWKFKNFMH